jgi:hypothetical protein
MNDRYNKQLLFNTTSTATFVYTLTVHGLPWTVSVTKNIDVRTFLLTFGVLDHDRTAKNSRIRTFAYVSHVPTDTCNHQRSFIARLWWCMVNTYLLLQSSASAVVIASLEKVSAHIYFARHSRLTSWQRLHFSTALSAKNLSSSLVTNLHHFGLHL